MRSPIEMMIDKACGFDRAAFEKNTVMLRCPECKRTKRVERHVSDLPGTATVEAHCDKCNGEDNGQVQYFRADGTQIEG